MNLTDIGFTKELEDFQQEYKGKGFIIGRIASESKAIYKVYTENGENQAQVSGRFRFQATNREDYPAVGDWVVLSEQTGEDKTIINSILPRKSKLSRKVAGQNTEEQIIATNIDTIFIVVALNQDFNLRRIERYLMMVWESGANPIIVLTKSDLCKDIENKVEEVDTVAFGVPVIAVSAALGTNIDKLKELLQNGETVALIGSSGVGKSTLLNRLYGMDKQLVQDIREGDDKGKHTTTARQMFLLPTGGVIIDTPGMREIQLWESDSIDTTFKDVEELAEYCRFNDCQHTSEPDCAVKKAIQTGELNEKRFKSYLKIKKELAYVERKLESKAKLNDKSKSKKIAARYEK